MTQIEKRLVITDLRGEVGGYQQVVVMEEGVLSGGSATEYDF